MNKTRLGVASAAAILVALLAGCGTSGGGDPYQVPGPVSYSSGPPTYDPPPSQTQGPILQPLTALMPRQAFNCDHAVIPGWGFAGGDVITGLMCHINDGAGPSDGILAFQWTTTGAPDAFLDWSLSSDPIAPFSLTEDGDQEIGACSATANLRACKITWSSSAFPAAPGQEAVFWGDNTHDAVIWTIPSQGVAFEVNSESSETIGWLGLYTWFERNIVGA